MKKLFKVLILFLLISANVVLAEEFDITADNVILYNLSDDSVLYELESNKSVSVASLTKIMTAIVGIENISDLDEEVIVTKDAFVGIEEYSKMGLKVGDVVTYRDLLYGIMLSSGADAVNVMALNVAGSVDKFVVLMNNKAKELGLENTHFDNPIGMDSYDNYSTASDIAKILLYGLDMEVFREIFYTREYVVSSINKKIESTLITYSKYMGLDVDNISGAKSGFTDGAGLCLASVYNYDDVDYLLVVIGSDVSNRANAVRDSLEIYDYYSSNYSYRQVVSKGDVVWTLGVKFGYEKEYEVKNSEDIYLYLDNSVRKNRIKYVYDGVDELNYFIKKGDKLGSVSVMYEGVELTSYDVYLNDTLEYYHPVLYVIIVLSVILMLLSLKMLFKKKSRKKKKSKKKRKKVRR